MADLDKVEVHGVEFDANGLAFVKTHTTVMECKTGIRVSRRGDSVQISVGQLDPISFGAAVEVLTPDQALHVARLLMRHVIAIAPEALLAPSTEAPLARLQDALRHAGEKVKELSEL